MRNVTLVAAAVVYVLGDSRDYEVLTGCLVSNYRPAGFKWNCGAFELWRE